MVEPDKTVVGGSWEFELQFATGDVVKGPYDRLTLREMLYTGRLTGDERIRLPEGGQFERLGDRPEFAEVIDILGPRRNAARRSGGWRRSTRVTKSGGVEVHLEPAQPEPPPAAPAASAATPAPAQPAVARVAARVAAPVPAAAASTPAPQAADPAAASPAPRKGLGLVLIAGLGLGGLGVLVVVVGLVWFFSQS